MITLEVKYRTTTKTVRLFNSWDVTDEDIVPRDIITMDRQKDKYVLYDDGFDTYGRIKGRTTKAYVTETGIIKRFDYCSFVRIQYPYTNYSGAKCYDEHPICRPYRRMEYLAAGTFIKTNKKVSLTPRIRMLIKDKMVESLRSKGITEEFIVDKLLREIDNMRGRGADRLTALAMLSRTAGIELEKQTASKVEMNQPLFQQFNMGTIQDQRRNVATSKELKEEIQAVGYNTFTQDEAVDFVTSDGEPTKRYIKNIKLRNDEMITEEKCNDTK